MERVHIIDRNMDMLFAGRPQQTYLDAFLYDIATSIKSKPSISREKIPIQQTLF
jgi:hypothetical protein